MKRIKKIMCLLLAMVLVLGMGLTAFAAGDGEGTGEGGSDGTYKITAPDNGHTYEVYQIFKGDFYEGILSNIVWGKNHPAGVKEDDPVDGEILDELAKLRDRNASYNDVLDYLLDVLGAITTDEDGKKSFDLGEPYETIESGKSKEVPAGYYLIKDAAESDLDNDAATLYIVEVVGDVDISPKAGTPEVDKDVKDSDGTWGDEAYASVGKDIDYRLIGSLPDYYDTYESYTYIFWDTLSSGLDYNGDVVVYLADATLDEDGKVTDLTKIGENIAGYDVSYEYLEGKPEGTHTLKIAFKNLKEVVSDEFLAAHKNLRIVVEYTAKLNENAIIAGIGNPNEVELEYSNNPNQDGEGDTGTTVTPPDEVVVFTFELEGHKVDGAIYDKEGHEGEGAALADAEFVLYQKDADDNEKFAVVSANGVVVGWVDDPKADLTEYGEGATTTIKSGADGIFSCKGLDAGTYYLRETKAPNGYNELAGDVKIVITVTETTDDEGNVTKSFEATVNDEDVVTKSETVEGEEETQVNGTIHFDVPNNKGSLLPSTGGIGTTIFYVLGGVLVVCCGVVLVTRKRVSR